MLIEEMFSKKNSPFFKNYLNSSLLDKLVNMVCVGNEEILHVQIRRNNER